MSGRTTQQQRLCSFASERGSHGYTSSPLEDWTLGLGRCCGRASRSASVALANANMSEHAQPWRCGPAGEVRGRWCAACHPLWWRPAQVMASNGAPLQMVSMPRWVDGSPRTPILVCRGREAICPPRQKVTHAKQHSAQITAYAVHRPGHRGLSREASAPRAIHRIRSDGRHAATHDVFE